MRDILKKDLMSLIDNPSKPYIMYYFEISIKLNDERREALEKML